MFKKNPNIVTRVIDEETILLPIVRTASEMNCIYTLNKSAARVWELINGKRTLKEIKARIKEEFSGTQEEIDKKFKDLISELDKIHALKLEPKSKIGTKG